MRLDLAALLADGAAMFRRDRALLLGVAGLFLFLPRLALLLLVPEPPVPTTPLEPGSAAAQASVTALADWVATHGVWFVAAFGFGALGTVALMTLYLDRDEPDLGAALARAARLWPRFVLMNLIAAPPVAAGLLLFYLPGLYVMARLLLAGPALVAERPLGAGAALGRGWSLSRGASLPLTALMAGTIGVGWLLSQPLLRLDLWLRAQPGGANEVALITVDALAAAVAAAATLASALFAIAAYRRVGK